MFNYRVQIIAVNMHNHVITRMHIASNCAADLRRRFLAVIQIKHIVIWDFVDMQLHISMIIDSHRSDGSLAKGISCIVCAGNSHCNRWRVGWMGF